MGLSCSRFNPLESFKEKNLAKANNQIKSTSSNVLISDTLQDQIEAVMRYHDPSLGFLNYEKASSRRESRVSDRKKSTVSNCEIQCSEVELNKSQNNLEKFPDLSINARSRPVFHENVKESEFQESSPSFQKSDTAKINQTAGFKPVLNEVFESSRSSERLSETSESDQSRPLSRMGIQNAKDSGDSFKYFEIKSSPKVEMTPLEKTIQFDLNNEFHPSNYREKFSKSLEDQSCRVLTKPENEESKFDEKRENVNSFEVGNVEEQPLTTLELTGNQPTLNMSETMNANFEGFHHRGGAEKSVTDKPSELSFHHISSQIENDKSQAKEFQIPETNISAILFASDNGINLVRPIWLKAAHFGQLGLITVVYNIPSPQDIQFSKELTQLNGNGIISNLFFVYGAAEDAVRQITTDNRLLKLIKEKTDDGAHVYSTGSAEFNSAIKQLVAKATLLKSDFVQNQSWYHSISIN